MVSSIMHYAQESELFHGSAELETLDELNKVVLGHQGLANGNRWAAVVEIPGRNSILHLATRCGMPDYVRSKIPMDKNHSRPALLREAIRRGILIDVQSAFSEVDYWQQTIDLTMAKKLIEWGSSPNHLLPGKSSTVWEDFLAELQKSFVQVDKVWDVFRFLRPQGFMLAECAFEVCRLLIANGAVETARYAAQAPLGEAAANVDASIPAARA